MDKKNTTAIVCVLYHQETPTILHYLVCLFFILISGPDQDSRIGLSTPGVEEIPSSVDSAYASHPSIDRKGLTVTDTRSSTSSSSRPLSNTDVADSRSPVQSLTPSDASTDNSRQTSASHDLFPCPHLELDLAVYPMYALMDMRRRTYLNWRPISFLPGVDEFVMLGFFYAGLRVFMISEIRMAVKCGFQREGFS